MEDIYTNLKIFLYFPVFQKKANKELIEKQKDLCVIFCEHSHKQRGHHIQKRGKNNIFPNKGKEYFKAFFKSKT